MVDPLAVQIAEAKGDIRVLESAQERNDERLRLHDGVISEIQRSLTALQVELRGVSTRVALITGGTMGGVIAGAIWAIKFFGG